MNCAARLRVMLAAYATFSLTPFIRGDSASDYAVQVSAGVQTVPPEIVLSWPADGLATEYTVSRKTRDDLAWGSSISLAGNISAYSDTNVVVGGAYEYRVTKSTSSYYAEGYIYAGIDVP